MPLVSTPAIVLATLRYGETSKIVRLATREQGIQSAMAKGALRPRSRYGAALQVLSEGSAQYIAKEGRELHTLTAFDVTHLRVGLAGQLDRYAAASAMSEVMLRLAPAAPHAESFDVMAHALAMLEAIPTEAVESYGLRALWQLVSVARVCAGTRGVRPRRVGAPGDAARCASASPTAAPSAIRARTSAPPSSCRARRSTTSPHSSLPTPTCHSSMRGTSPRTGACSRAGCAPTWPRRPSCRRSSRGSSATGSRHDHRDGGSRRPWQVGAGDGPDGATDGPAGGGAPARDHDRPQLRAAGACARR